MLQLQWATTLFPSGLDAAIHVLHSRGRESVASEDVDWKKDMAMIERIHSRMKQVCQHIEVEYIVYRHLRVLHSHSLSFVCK